MTILVVHLAGFTAAGYLSMAMSMSSTCSAISLFSMRNYQITDIEGEYADDEYLGSRILTCTLALVVCLIASFFYDDRYQILCVNLFMLIRVNESFSDVIQGIDQKFNRYDLIGKSLVIRGIILLAAFTLVTYYAGLSWSLVAIAVCEWIFVLTYDLRKVYILEGRPLRPVLFDSHIAQLLKICAPLVIFSFMVSAENMLSKAILQKVSGTEVLGVYSSIASPTLIVQVFATVAFAPFLPLISARISSDKYKPLRKAISKVYLMLTAGIVAIMIGAALIGKIALMILFGESIMTHVYLLLPIVMVTCLNGTIMIMSGILIAFRRIKLMVWGMIVDFIVFLMLSYPLIMKYGANGASFAQIAAFAVYLPWMIYLCEREISCVKEKDVE